MNKWDNRFLDMANLVSSWSKDPSTQVGCVLVHDKRVIATGMNGFSPGISDDDRLTRRADKYPLINHAEEACILNCARAGVSTMDATLYVNLHPCSGCARKMSRTEAKKRFSLEDLKAQTAGVECPIREDVIDEIPGAYKDIDEVMANQEDLVEIVHTLKQVVCLKG